MCNIQLKQYFIVLLKWKCIQIVRLPFTDSLTDLLFSYNSISITGRRVPNAFVLEDTPVTFVLIAHTLSASFVKELQS